MIFLEFKPTGWCGIVHAWLTPLEGSDLSLQICSLDRDNDNGWRLHPTWSGIFLCQPTCHFLKNLVSSWHPNNEQHGDIDLGAWKSLMSLVECVVVNWHCWYPRHLLVDKTPVVLANISQCRWIHLMKEVHAAPILNMHSMPPNAPHLLSMKLISIPIYLTRFTKNQRPSEIQMIIFIMIAFFCRDPAIRMKVVVLT